MAKELVHGWHAVNYHRPYGPRFCEGFSQLLNQKKRPLCAMFCASGLTNTESQEKKLCKIISSKVKHLKNTPKTPLLGVFHPSAPHPPSRARRITACCEGPLGAVSDALRPSWLAAEPQSMARAKSSTSAKERKAAPTPSPRA